MSKEEPPSKRPRLDTLGRLSASGAQYQTETSSLTSSQTAKDRSLTGRGSIDGWALCPLCGKYSKKKYALGKGIASHLVAIHTPWNPTKLSIKIERRKKEEQERRERQMQKRQQQKSGPTEESENRDTSCSKGNKNPIKNDSNVTKSTISSTSTSSPTKAWEPTNAEREVWDAKVVTILAQLEEQQHALLNESKNADGESGKVSSQSQMLTRTGSQTTSYRDSLPPFLDAAAKGDLLGLQQMVQSRNGEKEIRQLLDTHDRHLSTAEHWAAGGGHLECLKYLINVRRKHCGNDGLSSNPRHDYKNSSGSMDGIIELDLQQQAQAKRKLRRRDGKTSLHYAARNGHLNCVKYLIEEESYQVEEASGEGTLPLHMACFGGHLPVVKYLVVERGANVHATNEWGCDAFQFVGLTICKPQQDDDNDDDDDSSKEATTTATTGAKVVLDDTSSSTRAIRDLCNYLKHDCNVNLIRSQKQGHSILHKAAQKGNHHVLQWVADPLEAGGAGLSKKELTLLGAPDLGGHRPSQIWRKFHGDETGKSVAEWMESLGW